MYNKIRGHHCNWLSSSRMFCRGHFWSKLEIWRFPQMGGHHQISKTRPFQYWKPWWLGYPPFQETTIWPWRLVNSDLKSGAKGSGSIREPDPNRLNTGFHWGPREPPSWPSRKKRGFVAPNSWTHLDILISPRFTDFFRGINRLMPFACTKQVVLIWSRIQTCH